jgi:hypothetical protein
MLTVFGDTDCDGTNDAWIDIDTGVTGWALDNPGPLQTTGWNKPRRDYKALEFVLDRTWDNTWSFNASYTLAFSEGNAEGPVNSDTDFSDSGRTEAFDDPWVNFDAEGYLPNDRRHQIKLHGAYAINDAWEVGAALDARSGRPISAFGAANPYDNRQFHSFYVCVANCGAIDSRDRTDVNHGRGGAGRLPWIADLGANITYKHSFNRADLRVNFAIFNLFNMQRVIEVNEDLQLEGDIDHVNDLYGLGTDYQSRQYAQLTLSLDF